MMKQKTTIQWLCQNGSVNHEHQPPMAGMLLAGMLILAGLAVPQTVPAKKTTEEILTKLATPIKDIINMQELEGTTFHVINITEHNSVLPAEMQLAGKESDWAEGIIGYVDGKEVPTGLLPSDNGIRLMVSVPLKPKEVKKVTFKKGKGTVASDLKVEQEGSRVVVSNRQASWKLGPSGMEQFQRFGKTFAVKETGISNGMLKATLTPAVCQVTLSAEGVPSREYLFYPNSALWQMNTDRNYQLIANGSNAFYYAHPCTMFYGDPSSPYGAVIETGELEKGTRGLPGPTEFHLFSGADWGMLMDNSIGLGIYPNPSAHTVLVDTTKRLQGIAVQAVPIDERSSSIFKKWHCIHGAWCGWWRTKAKPIADTINYVFGATTDVRDGTVQRSSSLAPVLLRSLGDRMHGARLPWTTASRSETILVEDLDGNGPDMLNDRWSWCDDGKAMSCFAFKDSNKDGVLDDVNVYAKWGDKNYKFDAGKLNMDAKSDEVDMPTYGGTKLRALDATEAKHPVVAVHDWTRDGRTVVNCVFFGGRIDQDWLEWFDYNKGAMIDNEPPFLGEPPHRGIRMGLVPSEKQKFSYSSRALDLDADGDVDAILNYTIMDEPYTDSTKMHARGYFHLDSYDNNPFHGFLIEPLTGNLSVMPGLGYPPFLGYLYRCEFRYEGMPVGGQDNPYGNICLDGDGLPEAKLIFDGGIIGDDYVFRPVENAIGSSLYLSNRHALSKISHALWQEGNGSRSCYDVDVCIFPLRKKAGYPMNALDEEDCTESTHLMPKRPIKDAITTYRDKWGNEIKIMGVMHIPGWDGRFVAGSKTPAIVKDWSDSLRYDWDYMLATFEGLGCQLESGYPTHQTRWEFCADYAQRRQTRLFYSELDGRLHLTGAAWGHCTPYSMGRGNRKPPLDRIGHRAQSHVKEENFCMDCDFMRYYAKCHEAFFDEDGDGYLDSFLVDADNDGWYEERAWYDKNSRTLSCMKDGILVLWPRQLEPFPEEELLVDTEHYDKLVALKRMSEEKTPILKTAMIKAQPLSISVPGSNLWLGVSETLLPQVLLDTAHCDTNIWRDLSPKGYSRLLTALHRQKVAVREFKEKWSEKSLGAASVLFLAPLYTAKPDADEWKALDAFLQRGGWVVVACPDWSVEPGGAYALKADMPLVPGGKTGEWVSPLGLNLALKWDKPEPYHVNIQVSPRWDKTHFYLYAEVHDRDWINKETGGNIWKGDSIQFALADLGIKSELFGRGDWALDISAVAASGGKWQEYGLALTQKGPECYRWIDVPGNRTGPVAGVKVEVKRQGDRTTYQLALPWTEIGRTDVKAGTEIGFALVVMDRAGERQTQHAFLGGGILGSKDPSLFQKLVFLDTAEGAKAFSGQLVASPLDEFCASHGICRSNERTALTPAIDPQLQNRGMGPEVWERFTGERSNGLMKDVRKLFFNGAGLSVTVSATPLVQYQGKIIAAKTVVGKGGLLVLGSEVILNNRYASYRMWDVADTVPLDSVIDAKPDNNLFLDNLARYVVADQNRFKVLKAGDTQMTVELAGPGQVYVNKGTKVAPGGKETINGKESGNTMCFEVPASKDPIKLKISR